MYSKKPPASPRPPGKVTQAAKEKTARLRVIQRSARSWRSAHVSSLATLISAVRPVLCVILKPPASKVSVKVLMTSLFMR